MEHEGTPVAIDTAGNVDQTSYAENRFEEIDGKCFDLDGFHDGEVRGNSCVNRGRAEDYKFGHYALVMNDSNPDMHSRNVSILNNLFDGVKFGGIYVVGGPHRIEGNRLLHLNLAHCNDNPAIGCLYLKDQPDLLRSGIYLAAGVKKQDRTSGNVISQNEIEGYKIREHCIVASPFASLAGNTIAKPVPRHAMKRHSMKRAADLVCRRAAVHRERRHLPPLVLYRLPQPDGRGRRRR